MKVVVDTNIIFSSLLRQHERRRKFLCTRTFQFYSPNYVFVELFKHKDKLMRCTKATEAEVYEFLTSILEQINFVTPDIISPCHRETAYRLCADIDEFDVPFVALTLEFDGLLWTGDKKLREGLQAKGFKHFFVEPIAADLQQDAPNR